MLGNASPRKPMLVMWSRIVDGRNLAGRVARQREHELFGRNPQAVVAHPYQTGSTGFEIDIDPGRVGVEGVLHQLLDHGCGTLHHLAGRDLICQHPGSGRMGDRTGRPLIGSDGGCRTYRTRCASRFRDRFDMARVWEHVHESRAYETIAMPVNEPPRVMARVSGLHET